MGRPFAPRTIAVIAALQEGRQSPLQIAATFGVHPKHLKLIAWRSGIKLPDQRRSENHPDTLRFYEAVKDGYARGISPAQIGRAAGKSASHVKVIACKLGLTRNRRRDPGRYKRGFALPDHLVSRYRELRALGLTMEECGYELGLLTRPASSTREAA